MKKIVPFVLLSLVLPAVAKTIYVSEDGPADYYSYDEDEGRWYYWEDYWYDDGSGSGWMSSRQVYIDGEPGDSWENACSSIGYACDMAESGDTVLVGPGTYGRFSTSGDNDITIRSVAGAEQTIIDAEGADYSTCVDLSATDRIVGFTLQNSYYYGIYGGYADACIIRDCGHIKNERSEYSGVVVQQYCWAGGAEKAILTDCVIENCLGGGAAWCTLDRCIVRNCRGNEFGGLNDCIAYNTLVVGNRAEVMDSADPWEGHFGGATDSKLYNCTIVGNYAQRTIGGVGGEFSDSSGSYCMGDCEVFNSIVINNTCGNGTTSNHDQTIANQGTQWEYVNGTTFAYSCSYPTPVGPGNIGTAPWFADTMTYSLASGSAGINAGNDAYVHGSFDLNGMPRIYDGRVDMGASEYGTLVACVPVSGDFDDDGWNDIALFNRGDWMIEGSSDGYSQVSFGSGNCLPVPADYDGDGVTDLSVYDTVTGDWWIRYSSGGWKQDNFGSLTCKPYPADYDGDGKADLSVWDGRTGDWFIRYSSGRGPNGRSWAKDNFGSLSCIPVPADYDGDGKADLSVRDNATGDWWIRYSRGLNGRKWLGDNFGSTVCKPYPADYDGDGKADLSVYDQQTGDWFVRFSRGGWTKDNFGMKTCIPVPADYDGDGRADFAVFDAATWTFWVRYSGGGWTSVEF